MAKRGRRKKNQSIRGLVFLFIILLIFLRYPAILLGILGMVIVYFFVRWKMRMNKRNKILQSGIREIDVMQGIEFENFLEALFMDMGFKVETTAVTGDFGADLILNGNGRRIAVQAKRYSKTVGVDAVQQVSASKAYYKATEAWVVTNNTFSKSAYELAKKSDVDLIDRNKLINMITQKGRVNG